MGTFWELPIYKEYAEEKGKDAVAFSTFCKQRPKHVLSYTKTPLIQCVCEICLNPKMKMDGINKYLDPTSQVHSAHDLALKTLCLTANQFPERRCIDRECDSCGVETFRTLLEPAVIKAGTEQVKWHQWEKVDDKAGKGHCRIQKVTKTGLIQDCVDQLCQELISLPRHHFNHRWQSKQYQAITQDTPDGWVVITFDFAENYRCECDHQDQLSSDDLSILFTLTVGIPY